MNMIHEPIIERLGHVRSCHFTIVD